MKTTLPPTGTIRSVHIYPSELGKSMFMIDVCRVDPKHKVWAARVGCRVGEPFDGRHFGGYPFAVLLGWAVLSMADLVLRLVVAEDFLAGHIVCGGPPSVRTCPLGVVHDLL